MKIIAKIFAPIARLTAFERVLWLVSLAVIALSSVFSPEFNVFATLATLIGVTALIFVSRGDVLGQALTVVFAVFYGIVSLSFRYYGEMITYFSCRRPVRSLRLFRGWKTPTPSTRSKSCNWRSASCAFCYSLTQRSRFCFTSY